MGLRNELFPNHQSSIINNQSRGFPPPDRSDPRKRGTPNAKRQAGKVRGADKLFFNKELREYVEKMCRKP
jgi:hypothetical protein